MQPKIAAQHSTAHSYLVYQCKCACMKSKGDTDSIYTTHSACITFPPLQIFSLYLPLLCLFKRPYEESYDSAPKGAPRARGHRRGRGSGGRFPPPPALDPLVWSRWGHQFVPGHLGVNRSIVMLLCIGLRTGQT